MGAGARALCVCAAARSLAQLSLTSRARLGGACSQGAGGSQGSSGHKSTTIAAPNNPASELSSYELKRKETIEENKRKLEALGLGEVRCRSSDSQKKVSRSNACVRDFGAA